MNLLKKKKARLEKETLRKKSSKKTETLEQRKQRLAKTRDYNDLARRGQKSLKHKGNISNHEPTDRQTVTESLIRNFMNLYQQDHCIFAHAVISCGINIVFPLLIS